MPSSAPRGALVTSAATVAEYAEAHGKAIDYVPGALELSGVLEVGNRESAGEVSSIRLRVDDARPLRFARTRSTLKRARAAAK